jgi:hypothetical protein
MMRHAVLVGILVAAAGCGVAAALTVRGMGTSTAPPAAAIGTVVPVATAATPVAPPTVPTVRPAAGVMAADTAVVQALKIAQAPGMGGRLVGEPTLIRGRSMTYGEFFLLTERRALERDEGAYPERNRLVWVVEFLGTLERPPASGKTFPVQMVLAIDGISGEYISQQMATPNGPEAVDTRALPTLARPTRPVPPPGPTNTPYPAAPPRATKPTP